MTETDKKVPRWDVRILTERCKGCGFCVEFCGRQVLVISKTYNRKGYHPPEVAQQERCTNCKVCEMLCPDFSIFIVKADDPSAAATDNNKPDKDHLQVDPEEVTRRAAIES